ncbi:hypothetical protein L596_018269 [Steinernema carpocapsae]|uniref:Ubiquitin-like protease family profile domain-containing protein n=1 Tax=Steinernema carpocapsae TaxID=34508 RepID=A0A4V6XW43_STECR|nr:hypothetical protein L596_018269 [Steinernema carpocapsae]
MTDFVTLSSDEETQETATTTRSTDLLGDNWLTGETIYDYLAQKLLDCLVIDPIVFQQDIKEKGIWGSRVDLGCGLVVVPIHSGDHWFTCCMDPRNGVAMVLDSLRKPFVPAIRDKLLQIGQALVDSLLPPGTKKPPKPFLIVEAVTEQFTLQFDTASCGPLTCLLSEAMYRGESLFFDRQEIREWRQKAHAFLTSADVRIQVSPLQVVEGKPRKGARREKKKK